MESGGQVPNQRVSKKGRSGPAIFVERSKKKIAQKLQNLQKPRSKNDAASQDISMDTTSETPAEPERKLKKPGTMRAKSPMADTPTRAPLPASGSEPRAEDMEQRAQDMNAWVLNEIGANLQEMEEEKKKEERRKFKPKVPAQRYAERHPDSVPQTPSKEDTPMMDASEEDEDDEDWVIEEYIRVPARLMSVDVSPGEIGVLVLDGEDDDILFFGPEEEEDDYLEDDEDENGEHAASPPAMYFHSQFQPRTTTQQTIQRTKSTPTMSTIATPTTTAQATPLTMRNSTTTTFQTAAMMIR